MDQITSFRGPYAFLSNFFPCRIPFCGRIYTNAEAAFQSMKSASVSDRAMFAEGGLFSEPKDAKRRGRSVPIRPDWEVVKDGIMLHIIRAKFQDATLRDALLATGDAKLVEGNTWNDTYWGVCRGIGHNKLGKILMQVRKELRDKYLTVSTDRGTVAWLREEYPKGTRVRFVKMPDDPLPPPEGTMGTVVGIDDAGQIMVRWDSGSSLSLIPGMDRFDIEDQSGAKN